MAGDELGPAPKLALEKVEWRVDGKPFQGDRGPRARFVPYADARDIAALMDEWVGAGRWSDAAPHGGYVEGKLNGKPVLWCTVAVRVGAEWVAKNDVGKATEFEGEKGMVSDAFKRAACAKWGAGRNVYDLPTVWAPCRVNGKGQAVATPDTLPAIHAELARLGWDTDGGRVTIVPEEADAEPDRPAAPPAKRASAPAKKAATARPAKKAAAGGMLSIDDIRKDLRDRLNALPEPHRARTAAAFRKAFGDPLELKPSQRQKAEDLVHGVEVIARSESPAPAADDPPPPDEQAETVSARHTRMLLGLISELSNDDLQAMFVNAGIDQPPELADARRTLAEVMEPGLTDDIPEGVADVDQLREWLGIPTAA